MKLKILLLVLLCFFVGTAQQKDKKEKTDKGKWEELKEYPKPIFPIQPEYPQVAKLAGIQGKVFVEALISENGDVIQTKILKSEHETLEGVALEAVKKTKFIPGVSKAGKKVKATVVIPMAFKLDDKEKNLKTNISAQEEVDPDINANQEVEKYPEIVDMGKPEYPIEAKKNNITGKVFVKILVDKIGMPKKAVVIKSENEIFNQPSIDAAMKSRFTPAIQGGKPIAVWIVLPYKFALEGIKDKNEKEFFVVILVGTENKNYPKEAIDKKISGQVLVKVYLDDTTGKLERTVIFKSANDILNKAAIDELTSNWEKTYAANKKSLSEARAKGKTVPANADIKSGSIICVAFDLTEFDKK